MQEIKIYVAANGALGVIRDYANAKGVSAPTLVRGCEVLLRVRLFANSEGDTPYPVEQLQNITAWQWVMDYDYNSETQYILEADNSNITVESVSEMVEDAERVFTEISIPLTSTNTVQLAEWLGTQKSRSGLHGELVGYDASGDDVFVLQIENFTFRNRISALGSPTEIDPDYLTEAQVRALVAGLAKNPLEYQFSVDGVSGWHDVQAKDDRYFRQRIANVNAEWSTGIAMFTGKDGENGKDGNDGYTPQRGVDYWTDADKTEIQQYIDSQLVTVQTELEGI